MNTVHNNLNQAIDLVIEAKIESYEQAFEARISELERQLRLKPDNSSHEVMMQKEVFELLGIGRRRLKNWVDRGLPEIRVDNRVYYRYSELMEFIENGK